MDPGDSVPVKCVHGDTVQYATAEVRLQVAGIDKVAKVLVAPGLPVSVLLGRDLLGQVSGGPDDHCLAVVTRSQSKTGEQGVPEAEGEVLCEVVPFTR